MKIVIFYGVDSSLGITIVPNGAGPQILAGEKLSQVMNMTTLVDATASFMPAAASDATIIQFAGANLTGNTYFGVVLP